MSPLQDRRGAASAAEQTENCHQRVSSERTTPKHTAAFRGSNQLQSATISYIYFNLQ